MFASFFTASAYRLLPVQHLFFPQQHTPPSSVYVYVPLLFGLDAVVKLARRLCCHSLHLLRKNNVTAAEAEVEVQRFISEYSII